MNPFIQAQRPLRKPAITLHTETSMTQPIDRACITEGQRTDAHHYQVARDGYDPSTGERGASLQLYAARRSRATRERLFALLESKQ